MEERWEAHRAKFEGAVRHRRFSFSPRRLQEQKARVEAAKLPGRKKTPGDYALLRNYDILKTGTRILLVKPGDDDDDRVRRYVSVDELFDTIQEAHRGIAHGGQRRTYDVVKKTVANVTRDQVRTFLQYCTTCEAKRAARESRRRLVEKPIVSDRLGERGQVDLIDMRRTQPPSEYQYILHYQDHFTKFSVLRALRSKRAKEVADQLCDIFATQGAPKILQSDNGTEFVGAPLKDAMKKHWPETRLVHSSPRHPQSQGSVERANGDVTNMLRCILREKGEKADWASELGRVQWTKNTVVHRTIGTSPYRAVFGQDPPVSMSSPVS